MGENRAEAFSDGVFAIAITLLILEIKVPHVTGTSNRELAEALLALWPSFLAFVGSFATILVMWINHHGLFALARQAPSRLLFANGLLLLLVTFVPFPTALLAAHLTGPAANTAAVAYCGTFVLISTAYILVLAVVTSPRVRHEHVPHGICRRLWTAYLFGFVFYLSATLLAWFHPLAGVLACSALWLLWAVLGYGEERPGVDRG